MIYKTIVVFFVLAMSIACNRDDESFYETNIIGDGRINVSISALMGELIPDGETKSSVTYVVRLNWEDEDIVSAYCGNEYLGSLKVSVDPNNNLIAKLSGNIKAPVSGSTITFIHSNIEPTVDGNIISIDFSDQQKTKVVNPFVVYGMLKYNGQIIKDQVVPFKFATSLMSVTVTGLDNSTIDNIMITEINTVCKLTIKTNDGPTIEGTTLDTVRINNFDQSSENTRAIFNVGIVKDNNTKRKIIVAQGTKRFGSDFTKIELEENKSYISVYAMKEADGSRGIIGTDKNAHEYVCVAGTKWATQNVAITESGKQILGMQIGDFFQWGAYEGYCGVNTNIDKGLLIYNSFSSSLRTFNFKINAFSKNYQFRQSGDGAISPFHDGNAYTHYSDVDCKVSTLALEHDVANILWKETWRVPTTEEFKALVDSTYFNWDNGNKGYYVYIPLSDDDKGKFNTNHSAYIDQTPLLFFPAAGYGDGPDLVAPGATGCYWSSSFYSQTGTQYAYCFRFNRSAIISQIYDFRHYGFSVRPVSN